MISVDEALALIMEHRPKRRRNMVPLDEAGNATLAEDVIARVSRPPLAVSAMDGYAVRLSDVQEAGATLRVIGEAPAGAPFAGTVGAGEAVRIFTGAALPDGADHIVIQEDVDRGADIVVCREASDRPRFVRAKGLDFSEGDAVLSAGRKIDAHALAVAAAANHAELLIYDSVLVATLANGNELKPPGSALKAGEIINSNASGLIELIFGWDGAPMDLEIAGDTRDSIAQHISGAPPGADVFVAVGGASVGDHDHMRGAFADLGFEMVFEKVAVRPGKPTWFAKRGEQVVLGLPGNPASALVCAHLFLKPLMHAAQGLETVRAVLAKPLAANGRRETFLRARVQVDNRGQLIARAMPNQDSSLLTPFLSANALIRRRVDAPAAGADEAVDVVMIGGL